MFSPEIVGSDAFIEMPVTAQCLYFHLGMRADDDGFVNPMITMRIIGANTDDLKILLAKKFLISFQNGVVVIKHWRLNNFIRKDRYRETNYLDEKNTLFVKGNQSYTLDAEQGNPVNTVPWKSDAELRLSSGQPTVNQRSTQVRLGEVRLGKDREENSLSFLDKLPEETKNELSEKYFISPKGIQSKATDLLLYCKQKGKVYKNYKAFLENALRKDKAKLQAEYPLAVKKEQPQDEQLTPEQMERNKQLREGISNMLKSKKS